METGDEGTRRWSFNLAEIDSTLSGLMGMLEDVSPRVGRQWRPTLG
jgi:hypothetical protein